MDFIEDLIELNDPLAFDPVITTLLKHPPFLLCKGKLKNLILTTKNPDIIVKLFELYKHNFMNDIQFLFKKKAFHVIDSLWKVDSDIRREIFLLEQTNNLLYNDILDYVCGNTYH
jgi:hypothetical protein